MSTFPEPSRSTTSRVAVAREMLGELAEVDAPLGALTTYKVGGRAALMVRPRTLDDLRLIADVIARCELATLVVGRGSNMLVADEGFDGVAISLGLIASHYRIEGTEVAAGALVALPQLARSVAGAGLTGFEWAVGVPGSVGGAVRMNAGGHGGDMRGCLRDVQIFDLRTGGCGRLDADRLGLRFRGSDLADHQVVLDARLDLARGDRERSQRELDEIVRWRREHQPGGRNAGSVFVNPIPGELSAGELIDRVGLRGTVLGSASVSTKHANFIQAADDGRASDVLALIEFVRSRVAAETGFELRSEVRLVGFAGAPADDGVGVTVPT